MKWEHVCKKQNALILYAKECKWILWSHEILRKLCSVCYVKRHNIIRYKIKILIFFNKKKDINQFFKTYKHMKIKEHLK